MGMIMLLTAVAGMLLLALVAWLLSHFTSISFGYWVVGLPVAVLVLAACSASYQWVKEQTQDTGLALTLLDEQQIDPQWLLPFLQNSQQDSAEDKLLREKAQQVFLPQRWSYSRFASTEPIKISTAQPAKLLEESPFDTPETQGHYGYQVSYPNQSETETMPSRYFLNQYISKPEGGLQRRLLTWQGEVSDIEQAIELDAGEGADSMQVVGIDADWSVISVSYAYHSQRQVFLLDHKTNQLQPITKKEQFASARLEWHEGSHYMMAVSLAPKQLLLALYSDEKDYDDFFSSRGRSIPRITRLLLISEQYPTGKLVSRMRLSKQGMLMAIGEKEGKWLLETLDQRDLEKQVLRHFLIDPEAE